MIEGRAAGTARNGLVYTCNWGWLDLGHARADNASQLWRAVRGEIGERIANGLWFRVWFEEWVKRWGLVDRFD